MGKPSRDNFFKHILKAPFPDSLSEHISEIVQNKKIPKFYLGNQNMYVLPIYHTSEPIHIFLVCSKMIN